MSPKIIYSPFLINILLYHFLGLLQKNKDLYINWIVVNISTQRLAEKIVRMVSTQTLNIKNVVDNKYEQGCGNKKQEPTKVIEALLKYFFISKFEINLSTTTFKKNKLFHNI